MGHRNLKTFVLTMTAAAAICVGSAEAEECGTDAEGFDAWLRSFKQVAVQDGVSAQVVDQALNGVTYEPSVSAHDRGQGLGRISPPSPRVTSLPAG